MYLHLEEMLDYFNVRQIDELLAINSLIVERTEKRGQELLCLCPFHVESNPSFSVHAETGVFRCFSCGVHGSIVQLISHLRATPISEFVRMVRTHGREYNMEKLLTKLDRLRQPIRQDSIRYHKVLTTVSRSVSNHMTLISRTLQNVFRVYRLPTGPLPEDIDSVMVHCHPNLDLSCQLFELFAEQLEESMNHFNYYSPPQWITSERTLLEFYQQFVVAKNDLVSRLEAYITEPIWRVYADSPSYHR